jgi:hypothetical protein
MRIRHVSLLLAAALLCPAAGCSWMREWRDQAGRPTGKLPDRPADDFVRFLNWRAAQLRSVEYEVARLRVSGKGLPIPVTLTGSMAAAQPRQFRMRAAMKVGAAMDMGSNPDQFWAHVTVPNEQPIVIQASHADFESGRVRMPDGLPFEPDWVLQALGMTELKGGIAYDVLPNDRDRTYTLGWTARTPNGQEVRKEVVIDADGATGSRSQVKRHVLRDARSNKVIATADIRAADVARVGQDQQGRALVVQYPTHVVLQWTEPRFEMDLTLERATVNSGLADDPARRGVLFSPPPAPR